MDLTPFFQNVERIATALEAIARATSPVANHSDRLLSSKAAAEILEIIRPPVTFVPETASQSQSIESTTVIKGVNEGAPGVDRISTAIREIYAAGTMSANGIASRLRQRGIPHPRSVQWNNNSVKPFMDRLGLVSPYELRSTHSSRIATPMATQVDSRIDPEPDPDRVVETRLPEPVLSDHDCSVEAEGTVKPAPYVKREFVDREWRPRIPNSEHMNMRGLLTPETNARLEAFESARSEGREPTNQELIEAAITAGRVTRLPAGIDSSGYDHLSAAGMNAVKGRGVGFSLGSLGPSASGSRAVVRSGSER